MRRVWIEISNAATLAGHVWSPSMRRVWIEIKMKKKVDENLVLSPSMRRVWIEIAIASGDMIGLSVTLHAEGVD